MQPITPESLIELVSLSDPQISPDGKCVAFVRTHIDAKANKYLRAIWLKDLQSDAPAVPLTFGAKDASPRWSPDGDWLAFISGRDEKPQVYALPARQPGEAHALTAHKSGVSAFDWSPSGRKIFFVASLRADERDAEDKPADADTKPVAGDKDKDRNDPRVITVTPYRSGTTIFEDKYRHIYVADIVAPGDAPSSPTRVTDGDMNFATPAWSRDGHALYSSVSRDPAQGELLRFTDVARIPADGSRTFERLATAGFTSSQPRPSPDGRWLAMTRFNEDEQARAGSELVARVIDEPRAAGRVLNQSAYATWSWGKDSQHIYYVSLQHGSMSINCASVADGAVRALTSGPRNVDCGDQTTQPFDVSADGRVVFVCTDDAGYFSLRLLSPVGGEQALYAPNQKFVEAHGVCTPEAMSFESDGLSIQGWLIKPPAFDAAQKYPLIVNIHGGPHVMWGPAMESLWHEAQAMAHAGYVVFYCNPRGSEGYGDAFLHSNRADWDAGPMADILRGVEALVARGSIDPARLCVTGGSYGGYMAAMMVGVDKRFAAAVAQRGVYNLISARNTSDIPYFFDREMGGVSPWDDVEFLWRVSPIAYASSIDTPLLLEHSELDFRVPVSQAEEFYTALAHKRKTVELVRWPREGHDLSRSGEPKHRVERLTRILDWFNKYAHANKS